MRYLLFAIISFFSSSAFSNSIVDGSGSDPGLASACFDVGIGSLIQPESLLDCTGKVVVLYSRTFTFISSYGYLY